MFVATFIAAALLASLSNAFSFSGWDAGCLFSVDLMPYNAVNGYNGSVVWGNSIREGINAPALLYYEAIPGSYVFDLMPSGGAFGVLSQLPNHYLTNQSNWANSQWNSGDVFMYQTSQWSSRYAYPVNTSSPVGLSYWATKAEVAVGMYQFIFEVTAYDTTSHKLTLDVAIVAFNQLDSTSAPCAVSANWYKGNGQAAAFRRCDKYSQFETLCIAV
jgi:hypothetical protein